MEGLDRLTARLAEPAFFLTPQFTELMTYLRHHSPVHRCQPWPDRGFWAITRHADMKAVYEQPELFSNEAAGNIIPADPDFHSTDRAAMGFGTLLTNTDPPAHGAIRRIYSRALSGPAVAKLDGLCQSVVDEILDEVRDRPTFDFVMDAAAHLPARLICRMIGVPRQDWDFITRYANSFASFADPMLQLGDSPGETFRIAMTETFDYIGKLVAERRNDPRDDFATLSAQAQIDGEPVSHAIAAWNCWALLAAGFETSRNVIVGGLHALIQHPDQFKLLRTEPKLMHQAIDEMVRWSMPTTANLRVATADTVIGAQRIAQGDWLALFIESANRDEAVFNDPFRFDITRRPNPYLSFGHGVHNCIGRMVALLEVRVMLRTLIDQTERIELAGPLTYTASTIAKGIKTMPISVRWKEPGMRDGRSRSTAEALI